MIPKLCSAMLLPMADKICGVYISSRLAEGTAPKETEHYLFSFFVIKLSL